MFPAKLEVVLVKGVGLVGQAVTKAGRATMEIPAQLAAKAQVEEHQTLSAPTIMGMFFFFLCLVGQAAVGVLVAHPVAAAVVLF